MSDKNSQLLPLTEGNLALQHFTDRHELTKLFVKYLNEEPPLNKFLFFYGDGGNGKSLLLKFLQEKCCKCFEKDVWESLKKKSNAEISNFIQQATDWESENVPIVKLDFAQQPIDEERPQDPFYGLLTLHRRLVIAASQLNYKLYFPLYEYACVWYWKQKGKLTDELIKNFFPTPELYLIGELFGLVENFIPSPFNSLPTLAGNVLDLVAKYLGKDLTLAFKRRGLKKEKFEAITQLDPDKELIDVLPQLWAEDLNRTMYQPNAPKRTVLFFDTHEAFWGDWRNRGKARFFQQDEWLRCLLTHLDLSAGIVVAVAGRELPTWVEAARWPIPQEKLDTQLVWHLKVEDARQYLQGVGIEEANLHDLLIAYASVESEQVHPLLIGLCADAVLAAREKGETPTLDTLPNCSQIEQKFKELIERLLYYVDDEIRDSVEALSACRAFNKELYMALGQSLNFSTSNASFGCLTRFSFVWKAEQRGQNWYRIHPLIRRLNLKSSQEITKYAHSFLEQYYRKQGNIPEAIYHAFCQNWERGVKEWLTVFNRAKQGRNLEKCRILLEIRKELDFYSVK
ncbi:hypothetical protein [Gloeothece verrucosa]|uniref:TPR repeat-containing protein n=1 Tax=Gloeothece verrucosa (strain PCC 7822) TaxID=497965 RepID=E0UNY4_GLOV7|nr:hypothetical protein [Gloeothece verrucosa]ADN18664.1 TPR repeat-containing protein [Gloeothece verrucosa PCC 7822]